MNDLPIWIGSVTAGGTSNIFIDMLVNRDNNSNFLNTCSLNLIDLNGIKWPRVTEYADYVKDFEEKTSLNFRLIPWYEYSNDLLNLSQNKDSLKIWIATYEESIFHKTKEVLRDKIFTIAINYNQDQYGFVLDSWAKWQTSLIFYKEKYSNFKEIENPLDLYKNILKNGSEKYGFVLPKEKNTNADFEINIEDLYHKPTMKTITDNLGCNISKENWDFYDAYCQCYMSKY